MKRTVLASLCAATVLGVVGVPGVQADSRTSNNSGHVAGNVYVVKPGEWLARIATKNGVSLNALLTVNGFQKSTVIHPGQVIKLPAPNGTIGATGATGANGTPKTSSSAVAAGGSYTVKSGDSLSGIASRAGVTLNALLAVNGFQKSTVILPGQVIALPAGATASSSSSSSTSSSSSSSSSTSTVDPKVATVLDFARAQVGKPYRFGAAGPDAYDCSGLVRAAFRRIGITLPHSSLEQSKRGVAVDWRNETIRPGDLVFTFSSINPTQISHVGIAISDTQWIEAPFTGADVRITKMPSDDRIQAVRRIVTV